MLRKNKSLKLHLKSLSPDYLDPSDSSDVWNREIVLEPGSSVYVHAVSGRGKTSLISILYGMLRSHRGTLLIDEQDIQSMSAAAWRDIRRDIFSIVFQDLKVFEHLSAIENLSLKSNLTGFNLQNAHEMADALGISHRLDHPCGNLSLGERQRLAIIRAMCQPFKWLLLDEPFSHLDQANRDRAFELIRNQCSLRNAGLIMTGLLKTDEEHFDHVLAL